MPDRKIRNNHGREYARTLIEASLDPMITINADGMITDVNEATVKITGHPRSTLLYSNLPDYFTDAEKVVAVYAHVLAQGSITDLHLTVKHRDGMLPSVMLNATEYMDEGQVMGVLVVLRDTTAQNTSIQYVRSLVEASLDPLFTISVEGKITDLNEASCRAMGSEREALIGTDFFNYFTEPEMAREGYEQVFSNGFVTNYPLTIMDHQLTDVLFNGSVYKDEQGKVMGAVVVARDITLQKRISTELLEAKVFAEMAVEIAEYEKQKAEDATLTATEAVKAKQQFLSNMSHEIRTPMNAIIGFTKVVLKTDLSTKQREYLNAIKMSGDALIVLINDILDLAKVDSGKMTFENTPFKLAASFTSILQLFDQKIKEKNLILEIEFDSQIPEVLLGDSMRLHQILINLISNAIKFTNTGKISVSVKMLASKDNKVQVEFKVSDSGIGISAAKVSSIFENFQQATSSTSRLFGGTGLGLAICKQLVEHQGGTIKVVSEENVGSTFTFVLGFDRTELAHSINNDILEVDHEKKLIRVLVVEDIPLNQLLMKTLLEGFGFECEMAENGKVGVEKLQQGNFDVILMDLQMPEMNGFEATEYIRKVLKHDIPIIALTADVTTADLTKCTAVGMNDYLAKPVDERLLYSKIVGHTRHIVAERQVQQEVASPLENSWYINMDYLNQRTKSNPKLMMEMISLYLEQTPPLVTVMKQSYLDKDWDSLHSAVHKMIPSFAIMGIDTDFEDMARRIQDFAVKQARTENINDLVEKLEQVCMQACDELQVEFERIKGIA